MYLIKSLSDEVVFEDHGSSITIVFYISSLNAELSLRRLNQLQNYSNTFSKIESKLS